MEKTSANYNIIARCVDNDQTVRMTEAQKDKAVDDDIIHFDGMEWKFFDEDYEKLVDLSK